MSKKKEKKKKKELIKTTKEILPVRFYDEDAGCFVMEDGTCLDILDVVTSDRGNLKGDALQYNIITNTRFYRLYSGDIKFISMNFPVNTAPQRESLNKRKKKITDEVRSMWLEREINELELLDANVMRREFYMMYFGNSKEDMQKNKTAILSAVGYGRNKLVEEISKEKKIQIVTKLCNMNTLINPDEYSNNAAGEE